ncbi:MAG: calcium:proton antiporter [Halioglobus sp.]|nr:calcium:proton antiporter [Halioglobus sp.]
MAALLKHTLRQEAASFVGGLTFLFIVFFGANLTPDSLGTVVTGVALVALFLVMLWCAFRVVHHAESLAVALGEPYGTLILTLSVIGIEVALISAIMLTGADSPTLARDTMFSVLMIILNGLVGFSLVFGGLRHRTQTYNLQGANAFLTVLVPLAVFGLVMPSFTPSAPDGQLSTLQAVYMILACTTLYGIFLAIQTLTHTDFFRQPENASDSLHSDLAVRSVGFHLVALLAALLPIILLSKKLAVYIDFATVSVGAPVALGGFLVAAIILTPEGLSAVHAASENLLQRAVNICLGSALATISLTIPAVIAISFITGEPVTLGLDTVEIILLMLTLIVSVTTFVGPQTNALQGAVHLMLFAGYIVLIFDSA